MMDIDTAFYVAIAWTAFVCVFGYVFGYRAGRLDERDKWRAKNKLDIDAAFDRFKEKPNG